MKKNKEWFDKDLACLRQELMILSKLVKRDYKNEFLRGKLFILKKHYKRTAISKKNKYKQNIINNLEALENSTRKSIGLCLKN